MSNDQTIQENEKSLWERFTDVAGDVGNKTLLVREGAQEFVAGIPAIPGYILDLADMGSEKLGYDLYEGSAGSYIQGKASSLIDLTDPVRWAGAEPEITSETDQNIVDYTETGLDIASIFAGGAGLLKLGSRGSKTLGAAGRSAGHAADDVARAGTSFFGKTLTRGELLTINTAFATIGMAPVGAAAYEVYSGGALSDMVIENSIETVKKGIESGIINAENLDDYTDAASSILQIMNPLSTTLQNQAVHQVMGRTENPTPEQIQAGKIASISTMLVTPQSMVTTMAKYQIRAAAADDMFETQDQADKFIAEKFIDDIIEGSEVNALEGHQVTRDDVKTALISMRENHTLTNSLIPDRLENGLQQIWPELYEEPSLEQTQQASTRTNPLGSFAEADIDALDGRSLSNMFSQATDMATDMNMDLGWQFNIYTAAVGFLSAINIFGWADETIEGLQRHAIDMVQDEVVNQGENVFGVTDTREFGQENVPRPAPTGPQQTTPAMG